MVKSAARSAVARRMVKGKRLRADVQLAHHKNTYDGCCAPHCAGIETIANACRSGVAATRGAFCRKDSLDAIWATVAPALAAKV